MSTHTPGPWMVEFRQEWPFGVRIFAANGKDILNESAYCHSSSQKTREDCENGIGFPLVGTTTQAHAVLAVAEQDANARLIAAAPDGLAAAQEAYTALLARPRDTWRIRNQHVYAALRDFIAKATGRDPEEVQNEYEAKAEGQS